MKRGIRGGRIGGEVNVEESGRGKKEEERRKVKRGLCFLAFLARFFQNNVKL